MGRAAITKMAGGRAPGKAGAKTPVRLPAGMRALAGMDEPASSGTAHQDGEAAAEQRETVVAEQTVRGLEQHCPSGPGGGPHLMQFWLKGVRGQEAEQASLAAMESEPANKGGVTPARAHHLRRLASAARRGEYLSEGDRRTMLGTMEDDEGEGGARDAGVVIDAARRMTGALDKSAERSAGDASAGDVAAALHRAGARDVSAADVLRWAGRDPAREHDAN